MNSYVTQYATSTRASRVGVDARHLSTFNRIADLEELPLFVLVNPPGDYLAVVYWDGAETRSIHGDPHRAQPIGDSTNLTLLDDRLLQDGSALAWDGSHLPTGLSTGWGTHWAVEYGDTTCGFILESPALPAHPHEPRVKPPQVTIESARLYLPERINTELVWQESLDGPGLGAISPDRRFAIALHKGRFIVLDGNTAIPARDENTNGTGRRLVDIRVPFSAYEMSIVDRGYALLSVGRELPTPSPPSPPQIDPLQMGRRFDDKPQPPPPPPPPKPREGRPYTEFERTLVLSARRVDFPREAPPRWTTVLHLLDKSGKQISEAHVPFEVFQPPVDAGKGRVYLLGNGVAAFDHGKTLFVQPSSVPFFATAFQDGSLALAAGQELRILDRDGKILQQFTTREHEPITTPPAIAADGSIWVGTAKGLYLAR